MPLLLRHPEPRPSELHRGARRRTSTPRTAPPDMIVLHYTGMQTGEAALDRLRDPEAKVSSHYVVEEDGRVFRLVPEERRAWHAGVVVLEGRDRHQRRLDRHRDRQSRPRVRLSPVPGRPDRRGDRPGRRHPHAAGPSTTAASSATPTSRPTARTIRASCSPGSGWREAGHGLWVEPPPAPGAPLAEGDEGAGVFALQAGLHAAGLRLRAVRQVRRGTPPRWCAPSSGTGGRSRSTASPTARPARG